MPRATRWERPVELEIADAVQRVLGRTAAAARQHLDPGQQLGEGIGFRQIIVAASAQALDAVVDLAERRENQHWRRIVLVAERADHRQAVALGQHAVDHQHVVIAVLGHGKAFLAVGGVVGNVPDLTKSLHEVVGGFAVVFDDEEAHRAFGNGQGSEPSLNMARAAIACKPSERLWHREKGGR
ncbi:hypothetical protein ACVWZL_002051 [Bradyrhizobium sp. GM2.4]